MSMDSFFEEIKVIKEKFHKRIQHPYLKRFLEDPIIDDDRLIVIYLMLVEKKIAKEDVDNYIIPPLLVQAALDTHEEVSTVCIEGDGPKKVRQLTVLAGDYYSSLYYFLLSKVSNIEMIKVLADSIQQINEAKMSFYKKNHQNISRSIDDVKMIESSLIQKLADHFQLPYYKIITSEYFYFKRLITERRKLLAGKSVPLIETIVNEDPTNRGVIEIANISKTLELCDQYIEKSKERLKKLCEQPTSISKLINERMHELLYDSELLIEKVVEEG